jgi:AcrR family transcriptional regulator
MTARRAGDTASDRPSGRRRLSRDEIIATAIRIGSDDLGAVSLRRLAEELGVTPMALYHHVEDRDEIAVWVVDAVLAEMGMPRVAQDDWQAWQASSCRMLRRLLVGRPGVLEVYLARPVTVPAALRRMERSLEVLVRAGFSSEAAAQAYASLHTYTLGFAALEVSRGRGNSALGTTNASRRRFYAGRPAEDYPTLVSAAPAVARFAAEEQFERGLGQLIAGIAAGIPKRRRRPPG